MGARQSKRSVDITTTPKKDGVPAEGGVVGDAAAPGDGKLERIEETDAKPTTNGTGPHNDAAATDKDKDKEKDKDETNEKEADKEDTKADEVKPEVAAEVPVEGGEATTPSEGTPTSPDTATSPDSKESKKKDKPKKKWSFRSISFSKKDKNKPVREDAPKNGDVTKEEPLAEGGEEAEAAAPANINSTEEKSAVSSPTTESAPAPVEAKEEEKDAPASPTPVEEKKEEPTPAPTPVPVEEKKEEIEKVEPVVAEKVEVSPVQTIVPVGVTQTQPIATPSIIERKTSEDLPSLLPSSPPPTPIDPSPLQQAQQTAASASALAEALKVPAEAASLASRKESELVDLSQSPTEPDASSKPVSELEITTIVKSSESSPVSLSEIIPETVGEPESTPERVSESAKEPENVPVSLIESKDIPEVVESPECIAGLSPEPVKQPEVAAEQTKTESESIPEPEKVSEMKENSPGPMNDSEISLEPESLVSKSLSGQVCEPPGSSSLLDKSIAEVANLIDAESPKAPNEIQNRVSQHGADLVIRSEEGPLPVSGEILVEAKPALVIPEDNLVDSLPEPVKAIDPVSSIELEATEKKSEPVEVILEANQSQMDEPVSDTVVPDEACAKSDESDVISLQPMNIQPSQTKSEPIVAMKNEIVDDVPPPLPESPIPVLETSQDVEELSSEQIEDLPAPPLAHEDEVSSCSNPPFLQKLDDLTLHAVSPKETSSPPEKSSACPLPPKELVSPMKEFLAETCKGHTSPIVDVVEIPACFPPPKELVSPTDDSLPDFPSCPLPPKEIFNPLDDLPVPPKELEFPALPSIHWSQDLPSSVETDVPSPKEHSPCKDTSRSELIKELPAPFSPVSPKSPAESSPRSPIPASISPKESSQSQVIDDQSNQDFEVESVAQSLNSYNDSDVQLKERLAESKEMNGDENTSGCPLLNATSTAVPENAQTAAKPEAPAENPAEISTTESVDEAPASPAPAVPEEIPTSPYQAPEPAITTDVASVTKAIEEIDISDKAVAAAVNEAMECANTNNIITESPHQQSIIE